MHRNDKISAADGDRGGPGSDRALARPLHAERGRHLPRSHRQGGADHPDPRRLPRPSGDRPGLRRQGGARAAPVHGKVSEIRHSGSGVFRGINGPFQATRYHSLVVERASMPRELAVTAETGDGLVMGAGACQPAGAWRAVSSREHRLRARPSDVEEFPRSRRRLERQQRGRTRARRRADRTPAASRERHGRRFQSAHRQGRDRRQPDARGSGRRLRPHDVGRSHALADGRAADGACACAAKPSTRSPARSPPCAPRCWA